LPLSRRTLIRAALAAPLALPAAASQAAAESWEEQWRRGLIEDFAGLRRYRDDNARLLASGARVDVVFLGDSITEGWRDKRPRFFTPGRVGRGIGGQTTSQMVLRMMADVVALGPRAVHVLAGTNDIAGNTGPMSEAMSRDNFRMIAAIAKANRVKLLLGAVPPAAAFPWRPGLETRRPIASLNAWLKGFARETGGAYIDYHAAMAGPDGGMKPGLAYDGVHPTEAGYDVMANVVEPVLNGRRA
jgi:lysophospholipase L1-like esterase